MRKVVYFSSGSTGFSASVIKQRIREDKRSLKMRFRYLIREYRLVFKNLTKEQDIASAKKLFFNDLIALLGEAINKVQKQGSTLNKELLLTSIVPSTRKLSNKLNVLLRRVLKFQNTNGYLNKQLQLEFNKILPELVGVITDAVSKNEIDESQLEDEKLDKLEMEESDEKA